MDIADFTIVKSAMSIGLALTIVVCLTSGMSGGWFHHPDLSAPVLARRVAESLTDALAWYGELILSRGRSAWRDQGYGSPRSYQNAVSRLKKRGILAASRRHGREPLLRITPPDPHDQAVLAPDRWWKTKWTGIWYVLVYDVPESNRGYRDHLRRILLRNRCGCLQNSVWVSPRDLRPLFDDLVTAAALGHMAHLFEARTVLGHGPRQIVAEAWDFVRVNTAHARYQLDVERAHALLRHSDLPRGTVTALAREELQAFRAVIEGDPLLPGALHPPGYAGPSSFRAHQRFVQAVRRTGRAF